ncbi:MAG: phosphate ABC transporter permease PstA [Pseudanabaenaceae cyanobacterium SKYGB_i_bin29]|nr:phosphate ABC transporter permease PstA [Pseudanabaenaceae cyanobacterium SKYG29]MDW8421514.1 phosphate ABC transporter permease PstA [Pseudanabaenaceae cyanobacterium SKYGB_i_bin29]
MTNEMPELLDLGLIRQGISARKLVDNIFIALGLSALAFSLGVLLILIGKLLLEGGKRLFGEGLQGLWTFLTSVPDSDPEIAGIKIAIIGSFCVILLTAVIAVPLGIGAGIFLEEYAGRGGLPIPFPKWASDVIEINISNLAGVPSIIYGLLALGVFKHQFKLGETVITAGLTLALLILPIIIVTTREAIKAVPQSLREGVYAIGASRWQMIWDHILPASAGGILTGIIVGLSRAIGEAAPLVTIGALTFITFPPPFPFSPKPEGQGVYGPFDWLFSQFTVMPIQVFDWVSRPRPEFSVVNAGAAAVVLVVMTLSMNALAIYLRFYFRKRVKW